MMTIQKIHILLPPDNQPISSLDGYKAIGGLNGITKAREMTREAVIAEVIKSGLRGRGGAGFPTGVKWESVASDKDAKRFVVCNSAEGEPGTYKDRYLLQKNPYQMLEGILIASYAVDAQKAYIGIKEKFKIEVQRIRDALAEMETEGVVEAGFINIVLGPDEYLFGEEKALLEVIDGRGAMPRIMPPYMQGVGYTPTSHNPTVVNNVESMSNLPHILSKGADWYRSHGSENTPGTMIFTLSGDVKRPGLYELPMGTPFIELLYDHGGGPVGEFPVKAVFSGVANPVMTPDKFDTPLDFGSMRDAGVGLGSGGFIVYDESMSMVKVTVMFSDFLARSSCGQCIPCNMGTRVITEHLKRIADGKGSQADLDAIDVELGRVTNQTRCYLPVQETKLVESMLTTFRNEFEEAIATKSVPSREPILPKLEFYDETTHSFTYQDAQADPLNAIL